jgi:N-acetylneuraminate synthase
MEHCIIAEIGSVHDGSFGNACKLIEAAADCGADMVKFQTHIAEAESVPDAPSPAYFSAEPRMAYFERTAFSFEQWKELAERAKSSGITFLSSPFSLEAVDMLEKLGLEAYKIPSGEVTNIPLLERVARTGKPTYLSSGMSNWRELDTAVEVLGRGGHLTILQCASIYPCPPERVGLNIIAEMRARYGLPVGYSDHTMGLSAPLAAAALGATIIEKHFTFSRLMYGSDATHSMEPREFRQLCQALREVWTMLDHPVAKEDLEPFYEIKVIFEKSIVTSSAVPAGTVLKFEHLNFKKPGDGISAARYREIIGRRTRRDLPADYKLEETDLS